MENVYVKSVAQIICNEKCWSYFLLVDPDKKIYYPFGLGSSYDDPENTLNGDFVSDYSGNVFNQKHQEWILRVKDYIRNNHPRRVRDALPEMINIYKDVHFMQTPAKDISRRNIISRRINSPITKLAKILNSAAYTGGILDVDAEVKNVNEWNIILQGKHAEMIAKLYLNDDEGLFFHVISPRLALGKNVSFGGYVQYKGLMPKTWDEKYSELPTRIINSLYNKFFI